MVDGGNAPSLVCWTATSVLVGTGSGLQEATTIKKNRTKKGKNTLTLGSRRSLRTRIRRSREA
jgi:hypothetical protein